MDRPIVLSQGAEVDVIPAENGHAEVMLTVDGRMSGQLQMGDQVRVQASENVSRFVRMRARNYFYRVPARPAGAAHPAAVAADLE